MPVYDIYINNEPPRLDQGFKSQFELDFIKFLELDTEFYYEDETIKISHTAVTMFA
jgi:hypothetical protein